MSPPQGSQLQGRRRIKESCFSSVCAVVEREKLGSPLHYCFRSSMTAESLGFLPGATAVYKTHQEPNSWYTHTWVLSAKHKKDNINIGMVLTADSLSATI